MKTPRPLRLWDLWRSHSGHWSLSYLLGALTLASSVMLLAYSGWFISAAGLAGVAAILAGSFNYMQPGAVIRFFAMLRTAGRYAERLQSHHTVLRLLRTLRLQSFQQFSQQPMQQLYRLTRPGSADVLQRLVADIDVLDQFPLKVIMPWGWAGLAGLLFAATLHWLLPTAVPALGLILGVMLTLWPLLLQRVGIRLARQDTAAQSERRQLLLTSLELLTPLLMLDRWQTFQQRLLQHDQGIYQRQRHLQWLSLAGQAGNQLLLLVGFVWLGYAASAAVLADVLHPAVAVALLLGWLGLAEIMAPLAQLQAALGYALAARDRLNQLTPPTHLPETIPVAPAQHSLPSTELTVQLQIQQLRPGFGHALPGLSAQNMQFQAGDCVLLSAPSGGGKSCLLQTLAGDISPITGQVLLNDVPLSHWPTPLRHAQIGYLSQQPKVLQLTIAADLRLANPSATDAELMTVLQVVGLDRWLAKQPAGLTTLLGEYGVGMSGGELRRFALARLLLLKPSVLLLDEPLAGLDAAQAEQLLQRLAAWQQHGILIIASHQQLDHSVFNRHWSL